MLNKVKDKVVRKYSVGYWVQKFKQQQNLKSPKQVEVDWAH